MTISAGAFLILVALFVLWILRRKIPDDARCELVPHFKEFEERSGRDRRAHITSADEVLYGVQRGADRRES